MKQMQAAVEKGFKEATKSWGKELPDISNNTYDAVHFWHYNIHITDNKSIF